MIPDPMVNFPWWYGFISLGFLALLGYAMIRHKWIETALVAYLIVLHGILYMDRVRLLEQFAATVETMAAHRAHYLVSEESLVAMAAIRAFGQEEAKRWEQAVQKMAEHPRRFYLLDWNGRLPRDVLDEAAGAGRAGVGSEGDG